MSTIKAPSKRVYKKKAAVTAEDAMAAAAPTNTLVVGQQEQAEEVKRKCMICDEVYNRVANTEVSCCFCHESSCRRCIQTYLTSTTTDPHCMHCKKGWEREFIDDNLTATYRMGDYKNHRENILLDREIALMPATQHRAEQIREAERLEGEMIPPFDKQLKQLYEESSAISKKINAVYALRSDAYYQIRLLRTGQGKKEKTEVNFVRKCPDGDCRGFLSTAWKCGLCSKWACADCHEIKGLNRESPHECKPENVATAKLLAKDTKPCPGCAVMICKIEGCDQMWCPQCHIAFSWRTGQKEAGVVHNPHFYEWQRRQNNGVAPRVAGDIPCGGIPVYHQVRDRIVGLRTTERDTILNFHRIINHIHHVEIPRFHNAFNAADNEELRIQYLLGNISADALKVEVQKLEKKREKERAQRRAYEVLVQGGTDVLTRLMAESDPDKKRAILEEIDALRIYVNELLAKINDRLKLSVPQYTSNWSTTYPFGTAAKRDQKRKEVEDRAKIIAATVLTTMNAAPIAPAPVAPAPLPTPILNAGELRVATARRLPAREP